MALQKQDYSALSNNQRLYWLKSFIGYKNSFKLITDNREKMVSKHVDVDWLEINVPSQHIRV